MEIFNPNNRLMNDFLIILMLLLPLSVFSQKTTIKGTVTSESGNPLAGATVQVKETASGTITGPDGKYSIEVDDRSAILVFSFVGYESREIPVQDRNVVNVVLESEIKGLDEIIVIGYGSQKKSDITGTVASLPGNRLEMVPNLNLIQAIMGAVPGIIIETGSAGANPSQSIMIRGRASISADNKPLVIVDGIPYNGSISDINPEDIHKVEILRDASAAAIYGSRGANGVILVSTNEGVAGKTKFSYNGRSGFSRATKLHRLLTGPEFYEFKKTRNPDQISVTEIQNYNDGVSTDWVKLGIRQGRSMEHNLSVSGGFRDTKFYIGGGLTSVEGILKGDDFRRFTSRLNIETGILSWLSAGTRTQLNFDDSGGAVVDFYNTMRLNPLARPFDDEGNYLIYPVPENIVVTNPLTSLLYDNLDKSYQILTNNYIVVDIPFIKGLSYKLNTGVRISFSDYANYAGTNTYLGYRFMGMSSTANTAGSSGTVENIITFNRQFGKHTVFLTGLYSYEENSYKSNSLDAEQYPNDFLSWYGVSQAAIVQPSATFRKSVLLSQMFRANYSYRSRYLATFTIRRDGFSGFGENNKWGIFPSAALGWNISNENFFPARDFFNTLKIRISFGLNGNQAINPYTSLPKFTAAPIMAGTVAQIGYKPSVMGAGNLGWESAKTFNAGADFAILNDRLSGSIDWYVKNTVDLLLNRSISPTHGITVNTDKKDWTHPGIIQNIGKTRNTGIELAINSRNIVADKFQWTSTANFSFNKNEIISLYGIRDPDTGKEIDDISNKWFIGQPVRVIYDFVWDGVWQSHEAAEAAKYNSQPGYVKLRDTDKNGVLDEKDRQIIGQLDPKFLWGL
ncbi:MAG TPA: SusC/RagA family TonB-linked outer membrane protein, partial [Bacteroidales bacterium]|nr:SusC/RagA family TonB-linked outer membrane protein [Bacteroidales bacterium]